MTLKSILREVEANKCYVKYDGSLYIKTEEQIQTSLCSNYLEALNSFLSEFKEDIKEYSLEYFECARSGLIIDLPFNIKATVLQCFKMKWDFDFVFNSIIGTDQRACRMVIRAPHGPITLSTTQYM